MDGSTRSDIVFDVRYQYAGVDNGQCRSAIDIALGQFRTVSVGPSHEVTIGLDTDNRDGGCFLSFRMRRV
jgi:hypothetical protein